MQRRKFIAGIGSLAAASAAAMGTGAFSQMSASREADVDVVNDSNGLVALKDDHPSDVVRETGAGELVVDFTADGNAGGVNVNSRYEVGEIDVSDDAPDTGPQGNPAFYVVNQDTASHTVTLKYQLDADAIPDSWMKFVLEKPDDSSGNVKVGNGPSWSSYSETTSMDLGPGEKFGVSIVIDTTDGAVDDDLSGTLTVSAEPQSNQLQ